MGCPPKPTSSQNPAGPTFLPSAPQSVARQQGHQVSLPRRSALGSRHGRGSSSCGANRVRRPPAPARLDASASSSVPRPAWRREPSSLRSHSGESDRAAFPSACRFALPALAPEDRESVREPTPRHPPQ